MPLLGLFLCLFIKTRPKNARLLICSCYLSVCAMFVKMFNKTNTCLNWDRQPTKPIRAHEEMGGQEES